MTEVIELEVEDIEVEDTEVEQVPEMSEEALIKRNLVVESLMKLSNESEFDIDDILLGSIDYYTYALMNSEFGEEVFDKLKGTEPIREKVVNLLVTELEEKPVFVDLLMLLDIVSALLHSVLHGKAA